MEGGPAAATAAVECWKQSFKARQGYALARLFRIKPPAWLPYLRGTIG